jgi:hypothetical protein
MSFLPGGISGSHPKARGGPSPFARRVLATVVVLAGLALGTVALLVAGRRGPEPVADPSPEALSRAPVAESPATPVAPPSIEPPKREGAVALLGRGEDLTQFTERLIRRARGLEEGIERMFARDLEEEEKRRLFDLGLGPVAQAEALPATVSPEARARIAQRLVSLASDQFAQARRLQKDRRPGEPVFETLLREASRFHAGSQAVLQEVLGSRPSKG